MNTFEELAKLYAEIDNNYAKEEHEARANNLTKEEQDVISRKRELNDHAYYLFMFSRLEDHVREQSSLLIQEKQKISLDWEQRRAWSILPNKKDADNITFLNRAALLLKHGKDSHHFGKIQAYYDLRNKLAHGGSFHSPVSIPTVLADFELFYKELSHTS
ncbi:MAG: hypothetical protein PHQ03_01590 [Methylococcales bacterium]|nr:hypothetical protein [Methylococcales bacterium]